MFSWLWYIPSTHYPPLSWSRGLMVRYLMVPWVSSWSHGEIISWYHEFPHGLMVVIYPIHTLPPSLMVSWSHGEISHGTMSFLMVSQWDNLMVPWVCSWSHGCYLWRPHIAPYLIVSWSHGEIPRDTMSLLIVLRWDILMEPWVSSWFHGWGLCHPHITPLSHCLVASQWDI